VLFAVLLLPASAWAYRPFVSTDAAVADPREVEVELGYFNLSRTAGTNTITTPGMVLNYGVVKNLEIVGEYRLDVSPNVNITDPAVSMKGVVKEGILQDKPGVSVAVEASVLLPSSVAGEHSVGFETVGIVSGRLAPVTLHVNAGAGIERTGRVFGVWGVIGELPVLASVRLVGEINGEIIERERPDNSGLLGVIWQPTSRNVFLDAGVRRGISSAAPDWQFTLGVTFGFVLSAGSRQ
jgi:hypothetical protein